MELHTAIHATIMKALNKLEEASFEISQDLAAGKEALCGIARDKPVGQPPGADLILAGSEFLLQQGSPEAFHFLVGLELRYPVDGARSVQLRYVVKTSQFQGKSEIPSYLAWLAPFLAFLPLPGLLLLTATLPLYYTAFHFAPRLEIGIYNGVIVWLAWLPVWALLARDVMRLRRVADRR